MAAEAWGKLTGRPGIVMVTRGPGATNASAGIHVGRQDSTPMIVFIGQVGRAMRGARGVPGDRLPPHVRPDGEVDRGDRQRRPRAANSSAAPSMRRPPAAPARWCCRCPRTCCARHRMWPIRAPGSRSRPIPASPRWPNCRRCCGGPNGPSSSPAGRAGRRRRSPPCSASPNASSSPSAARGAARASSTTQHPNYAGDIGVGINPALARRVREADLLLLIGGRMSEKQSSGYALIDGTRAAADAGPCPSRRRGTWPPLPADARHQCQPDRLRRRAGGLAAAERDPVARAAPRPPTPPTGPGRRR